MTRPDGASREVSDLSVLPKREVVAERDGAMDAATRILDVHRPEVSGSHCAGCLDQWDRWIWFKDCAQANWAQSVIETYGATASSDRLDPVDQAAKR